MLVFAMCTDTYLTRDQRLLLCRVLPSKPMHDEVAVIQASDVIVDLV